jgi:hypothetical protein
MRRDKSPFFGLLTTLVAITVCSSLSSLLTEQELAFATTGDGGGGDSNGVGGNGGGTGGGGDGGGGTGGGGHHCSQGSSSILNSIPTIPAITSTSKPSQEFSFRETLEVSPNL